MPRLSTSSAKFNRRIQLLRPTDAGRRTSGEPILIWNRYAMTWGQVEDLSGREFFAAQQMNSEITARITMHYRDDVIAADVARVGGQDYHVLAPINVANRWLQLMCKTVPTVQDGAIPAKVAQLALMRRAATVTYG